MKIRKFFVSNSSSSSFVIRTSAITGEQMTDILNHIAVAKESGDWRLSGIDEDDAWTVRVEGKYLKGYTGMDSFDMYHFMRMIDVDPERAEWNDEYPFCD